jgi:hypothetical protein
MAKLKKTPGRLIGRWKAEAIASHQGAPDEDLAKIVNETAKAQGYDYTITPEKVRTTTRKKRKRQAARPAVVGTNSAPAPEAPVKIGLEDVRALKGLVDRLGADKVRELADLLSG